MLFNSTAFAEQVLRIIMKTEFLSIWKEVLVYALRNFTAMDVRKEYSLQ
jgi:hypothetical protein